MQFAAATRMDQPNIGGPVRIVTATLRSGVVLHANVPTSALKAPWRRVPVFDNRKQFNFVVDLRLKPQAITLPLSQSLSPYVEKHESVQLPPTSDGRAGSSS